MYLGIDLGTSSVKALLVDDEQQVVGAATRPLVVAGDASGHREQDPEHWWLAVLAAIDELQAAQHAPDEETEARQIEHARTGGGQMSRGRMVTATPQAEALSRVEAALAEMERQAKTVEAYARLLTLAQRQTRVAPRTGRLRGQLRRAETGE